MSIKNDQEFSEFLKNTDQKIDRQMADGFLKFINDSGNFDDVCTHAFCRKNPEEKPTYSCDECGLNKILYCEKNEETCIARHAKLITFFEEVLKNNDYKIKRFHFSHSQMMQVVAQEIMEQKEFFQNNSFNPKTTDECIERLEQLLKDERISIDMLKQVYTAVANGHNTVIDFLPDEKWLVLSGKGTRDEIVSIAIKAAKMAVKKSPFGKNYFKKDKK